MLSDIPVSVAEKKGKVSITFALRHDGSLEGALSIPKSSGDSAIDDATRLAIAKSAPFHELPSSFLGAVAQFRVTFAYNHPHPLAPASAKSTGAAPPSSAANDDMHVASCRIISFVGSGRLGMKRSGDVTASAILMFVGSGVCLFLMLPLGAAMAVNTASNASQLVPLVLCAALAAWGIATGVGALKLARWAWVSTIVMSGIGIFVSFFLIAVFASLPSLFADSGVPNASLRLVAFGGCLVLLGAAAIAIWWLVLFTRDRVRLQFRGYPGAVAGGAGFSSEMPTSILVICIFSLVGVSFLLLSFQLIFRQHLPLVVFGVLASGWIVVAYGLALIVAQIVLPIFTMRGLTWALDGMAWFAVINIANAIAFFISPAKYRLFSMMSSRDVSEGVNPQALRQLHETVGYGAEIFGMCVGLICLYFLITRRRAFRAACAPPSSNSNSSASATPNPEIAP